MKQTAGGGQAADLKREISRKRRKEALELVKQEKILGNSYARSGTLTQLGCQRFCCRRNSAKIRGNRTRDPFPSVEKMKLEAVS